jgi:hypothetical protein
MSESDPTEGLFGAFLVNSKGDVAFAQAGPDYQSVAAMRVVSGPCVIAIYPDGEEDMFTSELDPTILAAMQGKAEILIAHVDSEGKALTEYTVPLTFQL